MPKKLERIRELGRHLALADEAQGQSQQLDHLVTLTAELEGPVEGLERQTARCRLLGVSGEKSGRRRLSDRLSALRVQLTQDPTHVGQGKEFSNFKDALGDLNRELREVADAEWEARRQAALTATAKGMLSFLETIPELRDDAQAVSQRLASIEALARPEQDPSKLKVFLKTCEEIRERADRLNGFDAPVEVRSFLKAARSGSGARWESLTEEVRAWLEEHELLKTLRMTLG